MKNLFKLSHFLFAAAIMFSACTDDNNPDLVPDDLTKGAYILNYGGYKGTSSSITKYDYEIDELTPFYYQLQNKGKKIGSAPQYIYEYNDRIYFMNNNTDRVLVTDLLFVAKDTITNDIEKPRYCVGHGDYLYISCLGNEFDYANGVPGSYIVKFNVTTKTVENKIALAGGPEAMAISNGKLYVALNYATKIAVINLATQSISYITTEAVSSYFAQDENNNLYVTLVNSYSNPSTKTGLGYINTNTDDLTVFSLDNVSTSYASIIALSKDNSKVYLVAAAYDASWKMVGGVQVFNTTTKTFETEALVSGITGINGVSVNPVDGNVYVFVSNGTTTNGSMKIFSANGDLVSTKTVGADPSRAIFLD